MRVSEWVVTRVPRIRLRRFVIAGVGCGCALVALVAGLSHGASRPPRGDASFADDARGRRAIAAEEWRISLQGPMALVTALARCGEDVYLADAGLRLVHRVSLSQRREIDRFGRRADGSPELEFIYGLGADCATRQLYVVDDRGLVVMDADSGVIMRRIPRPATFVNALGTTKVDAARGVVYVSGLWTASASDWLTKGLARLYEGDRIGYSLQLDSGRAAPMFAAIERGCVTDSPNCLMATMDWGGDPHERVWVAAHAVSGLVGVFNATGEALRSIDVRSPLFVEDGGSVPRSAPIEAKVAWQERNSVIRSVFLFGDAVATVHSVNRTRRWKFNGQIDFDVFMNLHSLGGGGLVSDVRLPDLPVGRDDDSLYVVDYGNAGRRRVGSAPVTLIRIPVDAGRRLYQ